MKVKRVDILYAFAVESVHDLATFNRYVTDYPQYARTLRILWRSIVVDEAKERAKARKRAATPFRVDDDFERAPADAPAVEWPPNRARIVEQKPAPDTQP